MPSNIIKVAIVQRILAHYRKPIFSLLCQQKEHIQYTLYSSPINSYDSVKVIDYEDSMIPVDDGGLKWHFLKNRWFFRQVLWQKGVIALAMSKEYDMIIFEGSSRYLSTWVGAILARLTGKRVLMWSHGFLRDHRGFRGWLRKRFFRLAHGLLLYHNRGKEICIKKGFNSETLYVVYNSLDYDRQVKIRAQITDDQRAACRKRLFHNPELPILLFIGRLTRQKKLGMLLEAARRLNERGCPCNLLFVGDGEEMEALKTQAIQMGISENLCLYGACYDENEIGLLISSSDICVSPGEVGLTCMHSLVYGTPVITHDDPDFQGPEYEAIDHGRNGAFFKKGNIDNLVETIIQWLRNNSERSAVACRCYEIVDRLYNPHHQLNVINEAVSRCLAYTSRRRYTYDIVFITNLPAFYKINLYNRIAAQQKILVVFTEDFSIQRNEDFYDGIRGFEHISLGQYSLIKKIIKLIYLIGRTSYRKLVFSGWAQVETWPLLLFSDKTRNAIVIESSELESTTTGWKGLLKQLFLRRISEAYVSGKMQASLAMKLKFCGEIKITRGVGIFNIVKQPEYAPRDKVNRFLYVGRFSPEKNLKHLIEVFNALPHLTLSLVGYGPQEAELKAIAQKNIVFCGAVSNKSLPAFYQTHDVFVLPSVSEPWGLVVEEAINNGLPVVVSNRVGCVNQVVIDGQNGVVFDVQRPDGLVKAIERITDAAFYNSLRKTIAQMDFFKITEEQISQYIQNVKANQ